jgi:two-component system KDP operon response regulator KdpE
MRRADRKLKILFREIVNNQPRNEPLGRYQFGAIHVDLRSTQVSREGRPVTMSAKEFQLLRYFVEHSGATISREELLREVWGGAHYEDPQHLLRVNINNLRRKLEADPARPQYIITEPGVGYRLRTEPRVSGAPSGA